MSEQDQPAVAERTDPAPFFGPPRDRLPFPYRDESTAVGEALARLDAAPDWDATAARARPWVEAVRADPPPFWAMEALLAEYPIASAEGRALMRLAEALLRVPDTETAIALTADQLGRARFDQPSAGGHPVLARLSATALALSRHLLPDGEARGGLLARLGGTTVVAAAVRAVQLLSRQFVLGGSIEEALAHADAARRDTPQQCYSYDMLGEGARTDADALRHLDAYRRAIDAIAAHPRAGPGPEQADGISIKLSALFPRHEPAQRSRVAQTLFPRAWSLTEQAARADINLTIDAEECERLELGLDVFEALAARAAAAHPAWRGLGLALQAYQTRSLALVDEVTAIARRHGRRFMVRLVKGAYWDTEIKRAQELGLPGYPVYTHKHHTDIAYLACARALLANPDALYPQFASHNATTIAAILDMARAAGAPFELQRLHGMGEALYREVQRSEHIACRVYAPVGAHRDLLAYLVRRLLENGAGSSFVNQLADERVPLDELLASPLHAEAHPGLPLPPMLYGRARRNAAGVDLACAAHAAPIAAALSMLRVDPVPPTSPAALDAIMQRLHDAAPAWSARPVAERAAVLRRAADALEAGLPEFCALVVREAGRSQPDGVAEVREAVDFLRYYALQAEALLAERPLPGPTGETNTLCLRGRGVFVCISPWNFPLAIFTGQVAAALATGNTVAAKPAEQTPVIARRMVDLLHEAGVPRDALVLALGTGESVGAALVAHARTAGVCFTGSTAVARSINRALAARDGPIVPLIAETGGINAMIVDSTALHEQAVDAIVASAFRSAGQRCSALRLLCVHAGIADSLLDMLAGAMAELTVGDPALLSTDVGPVIDDAAFAGVSEEIARLHREARLVARTPAVRVAELPRLIAPVAFEVERIEQVRREIFGPVLQIVRWDDPVDAVLARIDALGYGLTLGLQTRIDTRALRLAHAARVGNVYVNRNMIGAVVGVQPFGGEGLSGTGPKAGGPHYLPRFCVEQTVTVDTTAAGGNATLLAGIARTKRASAAGRASAEPPTTAPRGGPGDG